MNVDLVFFRSSLHDLRHIFPIQAAKTATDSGHIERDLEKACEVGGMVHDTLDGMNVGIDLAIHPVVLLRQTAQYIQILVLDLNFNHATENVASHFVGDLA